MSITFDDINQKYNTLTIDPPWNVRMHGMFGRRKKRAQKLPYNTMTLEDIHNIPINKIANEGAHIYLWTTNSFLREAYKVFDSWGVKFHLMMVGVKPSGTAPNSGYVFATEFCLLGFYGNPVQKWTSIGKLNWFKMFNGAKQHSRKPNEFYNLVREMSPDPRLDVFSRRVIAEFDTWGDEAPKEKQVQLE